MDDKSDAYGVLLLKEKERSFVPSLDKKALAESRNLEDIDSLEQVLSSRDYQESSLSPRLNAFVSSNDHTHLSLERGFLGSVKCKKDVRWLARFFLAFPELKSISLKLNNLNCVSIDLFVSIIIALRSLKKLETLALSCNRIAGNRWRWEQWCGCVFNHPCLQYLNLANNQLCALDEGKWNSLDYAFLYAVQLKEINLSYNGFGFGSRLNTHRLIRFLKILPTTCEVNLSYNHLNYLSCENWFWFLNFLSRHKGKVILENNGFDRRQSAEVDRILKRNTFEGKTGGSLSTLVARTIWLHPDYNEVTQTYGDQKLPEYVSEVLNRHLKK